MHDPTPQQIETLSNHLAPIAAEIINIFRQAGIPLGIVAKGARRSASLQDELVRARLSRTRHSAHLTGDAVDFDVLGVARDQLPREFFQTLGYVGELFGLVWGGRWTSPYDPGHFELPKHLRSSI